MKGLKGTTDLGDLSDVDLVIESVVEDDEVKRELFRKLDGVCHEKTIFASNTSSLSIDGLASATKRPEKVGGMHFFNPVPKMHLVEVVRGRKTSDETVSFIRKVAEQMNKTVVVTTDSPCFIVNRILMPYLNEAAYVLEEGIASREDIDTAARLGLNHPMGPLALLDLIGLDVFIKIMNNLFRRTGNPKFKPPKLVEKMVADGRLGRKTGVGFYTY
jgi:3-hydroxybutyryl-CoA dehydrogenase